MSDENVVHLHDDDGLRDLEALAIARRDAEAVAQAPALGVLLNHVAGYIGRFVAMTDEQRDAVALWVAHTYCMDATSTTAYLHITSAVEESGKTRLLEVLDRLVHEPIFANSLTAATLYRAIDEFNPTLLIDEADNNLKKNDDNSVLLGIVNAGYRRGSMVLRMGGSRMTELERFDAFCPKAIAGIGNFDPTLASRCLRIQLDRRSQDQPVSDFYFEDADLEAIPLRVALSEWAQGAETELKLMRPPRLGVRDRQEEGVRILLAISSAAGEEWEGRGRWALRSLLAASSDEAQSVGVQLLIDIQTVFAGQHAISTAALLTALFSQEESPWREWWADRDRDGNFIPAKGAPNRLARKLKPFGIRPKNVRPDEYTQAKGYFRDDFAPAWDRYLGPAHEGAVPSVPSVPTVSHSQADGTLGTLGTAPPEAGTPPPPSSGLTVRCERHDKDTVVTNVSAGVTYLACGCLVIEEER